MATPATAPTPSPQPVPHRSRLGAAVARRRNPLWRRTDTLRARLRALLVLALAATAALSALAALGLYQGDRDHAHRYAAVHQRTRAVALTAADHSSTGSGFSALVRWTGPTGTGQRALATVDPGTVPGDRVTVWLDHADRVAAPPAGIGDSVGRAVLFGGLGLVGTGSLVLAGGSLARNRLNRVDARDWDRDWKDTEPAWSRRKDMR